MNATLILVVIVIGVGTVEGGGLDGIGDFISRATTIANTLGQSGNGQVDLGNGRVINWSYQGMFMGFEWKFMGLCTCPRTGDTVTVFKQSKGGAVEHCLNELFQKLNAKQEL